MTKQQKAERKKQDIKKIGWKKRQNTMAEIVQIDQESQKCEWNYTATKRQKL